MADIRDSACKPVELCLESPMEFKAQGRLVPEWKIDEYGLCGVLPYENARKSDCLDEITLVPMGAARLRISAFPMAER